MGKGKPPAQTCTSGQWISTRTQKPPSKKSSQKSYRKVNRVRKFSPLALEKNQSLITDFVVKNNTGKKRKRPRVLLFEEDEEEATAQTLPQEIGINVRRTSCAKEEVEPRRGPLTGDLLATSEEAAISPPPPPSPTFPKRWKEQEPPPPSRRHPSPESTFPNDTTDIDFVAETQFTEPGDDVTTGIRRSSGSPPRETATWTLPDDDDDNGEEEEELMSSRTSLPKETRSQVRASSPIFRGTRIEVDPHLGSELDMEEVPIEERRLEQDHSRTINHASREEKGTESPLNRRPFLPPHRRKGSDDGGGSRNGGHWTVGDYPSSSFIDGRSGRRQSSNDVDINDPSAPPSQSNNDGFNSSDSLQLRDSQSLLSFQPRQMDSNLELILSQKSITF